MGSVFTVLIALGLMSPAPEIEDRREICRVWFPRCQGNVDPTPESQMASAREMLVWMPRQSRSNWNSPLSHAAGELDLMRAEGEYKLRQAMLAPRELTELDLIRSKQ